MSAFPSSTATGRASSSSAFVPASIATLGYAMFALQQDVPLEELHAIAFYGINIGTLPADKPSSELGQTAVITDVPEGAIYGPGLVPGEKVPHAGGAVPGGMVGMFADVPADLGSGAGGVGSRYDEDALGVALTSPDSNGLRASETINILKDISFLDD